MEIGELYTADIHDAGAEMQVQDQNGLALDCYIRLLGMDSTVLQKATRENQRSAIKRMMSDEESDVDDNLELAIKATVGWRGFTNEGAEFEFSKVAVRKLYEKAPYIVDQVILFINNRANFMKG